MKTYKILTAALAAAALGGTSAMAQFNYQNGDMLAAFGNGGSTDVIVDLGSIASFQSTSGPALTYNLDAVLTSVFGSVDGSIYWGVFGVNDTTETPSNPNVTQANAYTIWASEAGTSTTPHVSGQANSQLLAVGDIETIANLTSPGDASTGQIVDYAPGIELVSTSPSLSGFSSQMTGAYNGNFQGDLGWNILYGTPGADPANGGAGTSILYQSNPGNPNTQYTTPLGGLTLDSGGVLTFNPVPEPSTWAMIGSGALALLALRRRK